jgi:hypothetical protein
MKDRIVLASVDDSCEEPLYTYPLKPIEPKPMTHNEREDTKQRKKNKNSKYTYELVYDYDHLYISYKKAKVGCSWKKSVQKFEKHPLLYLAELHSCLLTEEYKQKPFQEFQLQERGKTRWIKAMDFRDRIVQRTLTDNILTPAIKDYLIFDNGASLQDKGVDFCRRRLEYHLHDYFREHGNQGYILKIDYSKFFDNLLHSYVKSVLYDIIEDKRVRSLIDEMVDSFRQDVSYMDDDEYVQCLITTFNSIDYQFLSKGKQTGDKWMDKSVGIGSHLAQICGIAYPIIIDNFCKTVKGLKWYGRYMDDIYIIHPSKEYLQKLLGELNELSESVGLHINNKKTQIIPLHHEFTFLQIKYTLTDTGHLVRRASSKALARERRRLKSMNRLCEDHRMKYSDVVQCYKSWRGNMEKYDTYHSLQSMDQYFQITFGFKYDEYDPEVERIQSLVS